MRVQDGPLRINEDAEGWMGSTIVPIHFPVSSNIQFPVFYHFPFLSTFLPYQRAKMAVFHRFFTISSTAENGPNGRIKAE